MNILILFLIGVLIMEMFGLFCFFLWYRSYNWNVIIRYLSGSRKGLIKMFKAKISKKKGVKMLVFMKRSMRARKLPPAEVVHVVDGAFWEKHPRYVEVYFNEKYDSMHWVKDNISIPDKSDDLKKFKEILTPKNALTEEDQILLANDIKEANALKPKTFQEWIIPGAYIMSMTLIVVLGIIFAGDYIDMNKDYISQIQSGEQIQLQVVNTLQGIDQKIQNIEKGNLPKISDSGPPPPPPG